MRMKLVESQQVAQFVGCLGLIKYMCRYEAEKGRLDNIR